MVVGDKKQAAILGIVATIILCVGVFEIIPKGSKSAMAEAIRATDAAAATHQKEIDQELPSAITSSPFSKPQALKVQPATGIADGKGQDHGANAELKHKGGQVPPMHVTIHGDGFSSADSGGSTGGGSTSSDPTGATQSNGALPTVTDPSGNAGSSQQPIKEQSKTATLDAVMKTERWTAVISVTGREEPMQLEVGQSIGSYRILAIDESSITYLDGRAVKTLTVGSSVSL